MRIETAKRKKGTVHRARIDFRGNEYRTSWFGTKNLAKEAGQKLLAELHTGLENTGASMTLRQFGDLWLEKHAFARKEYTSALRDQQYLNRHIYPRLGGMQLKKIKPEDIQFFFSDLIRKGTLAPKTCNNCLGTLKKILNDAVEWNKLSRNPAQSVKLLKIPQQKVEIFSQSEILQLLSFSERLFPNEYELFVFALNTGCRIGECCGLKWDSIDLNRRIITIESIFDEKLDRIAKRTKGKRARLVPINPEVFDLLLRMKNEQRHTESDLVFSRCDYKKITHKTFQKILKEAGIPNEQKPRRSFHTLRHTFASEFMKNSGDIYRLQHILGHSTSKQTEQYAHFAPEWLKGETDRVSFTLKKGEVIPLARAAHQAALS